MILPDYDGGALPDVLPAVATALGVPRLVDRDSEDRIVLPASSRYVVLLVDGLGLGLLEEHADDAPYLWSLLADDAGRRLTVGMPTTTATSLTSLGSALTPGQHGVVGFTCRIPGTNRLLNALRWDSKVDAREWQPHPTAFERLEREGIATTVVSKRSFERSGLTIAGQRGARYAGADSAGERLAETAAAVRTPGSMAYVYDSELDATGHRDGCRSDAWRLQLATVDAFALRLRQEIPDDAVLVVTGDHGMVDVPADCRVDVDAEPALLEDVGVFAGEARLRQLYCRAGATEEVAERWRSRLGADALVLTREQAIDEGWFGAVDRDVLPRIGDVLVACLGPIAVMSSERFPLELSLVGLHGSLTHAEMVVPLLVDPGRMVARV